ncbi:pre-mRNA processing factor 3-domain-containing protein [Lentinula edodes]|uniref:Pre-mRNA processing factor 3-domain-containing protein n=1 Tax=Lentinula lateritia TaxID=40482 RepID=A0A9W9B163_9AGAR|nr:pre-mRNA processing factor 3-domain-containing protein [Lentinula edodes]
MSDRKRPLDGNGGGVNKKFKSDASTTETSSSTAAMIAQKRAEIAAKMAKMRNSVLSGAGVTLPGTTAPTTTTTTTAMDSLPKKPTPSDSVTPVLPADLARRVAEAKRKVAEYQTKLAVKDNPYMSGGGGGGKPGKMTQVEPTQQGSGLKMTAHPLLLEQTTGVLVQSKKDRYKPIQPKFASIKANARNIQTPPPIVHSPSPSSNPYTTSTDISSSATTAFPAPAPRPTRSTFRFNPKGKYVALGNQIRQDLQLEALKNRIAESARKAGMDGDMGIGGIGGVERSIKRPPPSAAQAEWWDIPLLPNKTYADIELYGIEGLNVRNGETSPITIYVQHPIKIPPPGSGGGGGGGGLKPLMLTKKEQKKMRKLRRAGELQDKRDRIRMGLLPPDPPKVRLSNLMKVLTSDAIQDPTRVEAKVRREVAMRKHQHEKMNAERKLTDEQRREKIESKKLEEEKKGIYGAVFKIQTLSSPSHRFKIQKNAVQMGLTGVCVVNPNFGLVYVEGAGTFVRRYKRLMLVRIKWTEEGRGGDVPGDADGEEAEKEEDDNVPDGFTESSKPTTTTTTTSSISLASNTCNLIWEGLLPHRSFAGFKPKVCPTDGAAREALGEKLRGYWDVARAWRVEEDVL